MAADVLTELTRPAPVAPPTGSPPPRGLPGGVQTGVAALVAALLIVRITGTWGGATSPVVAVVLVAAFALLLGIVIVTAATRSGRIHRSLDAVLLVVAAVVVCVEQRGPLGDPGRSYPSDEGRLVQHAIAAVQQGRSPYAHGYPDVAHFAGNTPLFSGGGWHLFGYPPLSAELGALLGQVRSSWATPGAVGLVGLLGTAVVCFLVLPPVWRTVGIGATLGLTPLTTYAVNGHPAMLALPLLCLACAGWSRIGASGRLGVVALLQAVCLGLAAAAQQLAWFPAIGLVLSLWLVRRGPLGTRAASALVARFTAVAVAAFTLVDLPFIVAGPGDWLHGVLAQFAGPHAVASGQGLVALALVVQHGGGAFEFWSYASGLLLLGLLIVIALGFRRLAAVVPVVLSLVFLVSIRSQAEYVLTFVPLWVVWAAGTDPDALRSAPALLRAPWRRLGAAAAVVPAAACVVVAVAVPAPLRLEVVSTSMRGGRITIVQVSVTNLTGRRIVPSFYVDPASHLRSPWAVVTGPRSLTADQHVTLTLRPALLGPERPTAALRVWALSDSPQAMSSAALNAGRCPAHEARRPSLRRSPGRTSRRPCSRATPA